MLSIGVVELGRRYSCMVYEKDRDQAMKRTPPNLARLQHRSNPHTTQLLKLLTANRSNPQVTEVASIIQVTADLVLQAWYCMTWTSEWQNTEALHDSSCGLRFSLGVPYTPCPVRKLEHCWSSAFPETLSLNMISSTIGIMPGFCCCVGDIHIRLVPCSLPAPSRFARTELGRTSLTRARRGPSPTPRCLSLCANVCGGWVCVCVWFVCVCVCVGAL